MDIYEVIKKRRSCRSYKTDPVDDEKLTRVLEAARLAPSAANRQPFCMVAVKDKNKKRMLGAAYSKEWFLEAPIIICACVRPSQAWKRGDGKNYADVDVSIAMEHLVLAATKEGLGACWVAAFKARELKDFVEDVFNEKGVEPVAMTPLGYPNEVPAPSSRKPFDELFKIV